MNKVHPLKEIVRLQKAGVPVGITSICSANKMVLEAVMERALILNNDVLIEATANQVNQFGGYTGMKPADFTKFVAEIAESVGFPMNKVILGGDHLGPLTWVDLDEEEAMANAEVLVADFVKAGFTKIHLDTSMKVASDSKDDMLATKVIAERGARLAVVCDKAFKEYEEENPDAVPPVYVIGSEVPIPGGAQEEEEEGLQVTKVADFTDTVDIFKTTFENFGLEELWDEVIGVVVQPGVEFGDDSIDEYDRVAAKDLMEAIKEYPTLVFEGHSTDYQTPKKLLELVEDGVAILKVGPAVTFGLREALFELAKIEEEMISEASERSNLVEIIEAVMLENPKNWKKHYHGSEVELKRARKYSFSDRVRYYIGDDKVQKAIDTLFENLRDTGMPYSLLSQYVPVQYAKIRKGELANDPKAIALDGVVQVVDEYNYAIFPDTIATIKHHFA